MKLLNLSFYPIEGKHNCFKVIVEGSEEAHYEPTLPFLDTNTTDVEDRRFTVVKLLESTKFNKENFSEDEQHWMVHENLLRADLSDFNPQYLATIGDKLYNPHSALQ